jgi:hypothetical protein
MDFEAQGKTIDVRRVLEKVEEKYEKGKTYVTLGFGEGGLWIFFSEVLRYQAYVSHVYLTVWDP